MILYKFFYLLLFLTFSNSINYTNNITNSTLPLYLRRKTKYCNFKCDCFFSHSVKNDNIFVPNWIKTSGIN